MSTLSTRRFNHLCGILTILLLAAEVSSSQLPSPWSQHIHEGKTYYYNQQTGTTQWEPPIEFQNIPKNVPRDDTADYEYYQHTDSQNIPRQGESSQGTFPENPQNVPQNIPERDPWEDVDIDDDEYASSTGTSGGGSGGGVRGKGQQNMNDGDYSDDDWHDDRYRMGPTGSDPSQTFTGKRLAKVTKTFSNFRTGFSSFKALIKAKATSKKKELFGGRAVDQNRQQQQQQGGQRGGDYDYDDENYRKRNENDNDYYNDRSTGQDSKGDRREAQGQQTQRQQWDTDAVNQSTAPSDRNADNSNNHQYSDNPRSNPNPQQPGGASDQRNQNQFQNQKDNQQPNTGKRDTRGTDEQKNKDQQRNKNTINEKSAKDIEKEEEEKIFNKKNIDEKKIFNDFGKDLEAQEYSHENEEKPLRKSEKISVRSIGKSDEDLWGDYDENDEKNAKKKSKKIEKSLLDFNFPKYEKKEINDDEKSISRNYSKESYLYHYNLSKYNIKNKNSKLINDSENNNDVKDDNQGSGAGSDEDELEYYLYLNDLLEKKHSREEMSKWGLEDSILTLKSEELKRIKGVHKDKLKNNNKNNGGVFEKKTKKASLFNDNNNVRINSHGLYYNTRQIFYITIITILSANSIINIIKENNKNKINFATLFDNITVPQLPNKFMEFFQIYGFDQVFVFLREIFTRILSFVQKLFDDFDLNFVKIPSVSTFSSSPFSTIFSKIPDFSSLFSTFFSVFLSSFFSVFSSFLKDKSYPNLSTIEILKSETSVQVGRTLLFIGSIIIPYLLWYRFLSSLFTAVTSVIDILTVKNMLKEHSSPSSPSLFDDTPQKLQSTKFLQNYNCDSEKYGNEIYGNDIGWTTEGPDKASGIILKNLKLSQYGNELIKDFSASFVPGTITVILTANTKTRNSFTQNSNSKILELIYGMENMKNMNNINNNNDNDNNYNNNDNNNVKTDGSVLINGREIKEWNLKFLRSKMVYLHDDEMHYSLPAGILSGHPLSSSPRDDVIADISQAGAVCASLPKGGGTVVGGVGARLTQMQWKALSLSRALHAIDHSNKNNKNKNILLLDNPCESLSEAQERKLFQFLRGEMTPNPDPNSNLTHTSTTAHPTNPTPTTPIGGPTGSDKIIILTAIRFSTAVHVDRIIVMVDGAVDQVGTYKELISRPGTFRNELFSNS